MINLFFQVCPKIDTDEVLSNSGKMVSIFLESLAGSKGGGAHLTAGLSGQANNCWHGMGMSAPDIRCGAKPCPDSHSFAEV